MSVVGELTGFVLMFLATAIVFVVVMWLKKSRTGPTKEFFMIFPLLFLYGIFIDEIMVGLLATAPPTQLTHFTAQVGLPITLYVFTIATVRRPPREKPLSETTLPESMQTNSNTHVDTKPISDSVTQHNILEENE